MKCESAALTSLAFNTNITAVRLHDSARDGETQPGSACGAAAGFFSAIEAIEDMRKVFRADTFA